MLEISDLATFSVALVDIILLSSNFYDLHGKLPIQLDYLSVRNRHERFL